ncbi:MAG: hypothetical protein N2170_08020 [Bacteroidia bacterium]|nr:hypothetical protein [Bacteroidia bacterium]
MCIRSCLGHGRWKLWLSIAFYLLLNSCSSREALPPAYLRVGDARVLIEGDTLLLESPIDAWVYPEGKYLTLLEPGGRTPIVPSTTRPILLAGGVRVGGVSVSRRPYPFWQFDTIWGPLSPEVEYYHQPLYTYLPDTLLDYILRETFESPQLGFRLANAGDPNAASLRRTLETPRRGFWAGEVSLPAYSDFQAESAISFEFPQQEIWAEISVRGERNLGVGLVTENRQTGALMGRDIYLILRPPEQRWATFHIDLTPWLAGKGTLFRYRLYLTSAGDTTGTATLYLDDIRLITLKRQ